MAQELHVTLDVIRAMSSEEYLGWIEYLTWAAEAERKAFKDAKNKKTRR